MDIVDAEWRELPDEPEPVSPAIQTRARLAQAVALRDMQTSRYRRNRYVSAPAPRLQLTTRMDPLWQAACGGSRLERARAAEMLALNEFVQRPRRPHPPLRSI